MFGQPTQSTQEIVIVVDRSGSMKGKEDDTVGGINAFIGEMKNKMKGDEVVKVSLKLFDNEEILKWRSVDIKEIGEFPRSEFIPRGSTALLDAIGLSLTFFMEKKLKDPSAYNTCTLCVVTDGLENSSVHFNRTKIQSLIKNAKDTYNIDMMYLAANQDAILEASKMGIDAGRAINYTESTECTQAVYRSAARVASDGRHDSKAQFSQPERMASQTPSHP
jgi:hypothetical protein